MKQNAEEIKRFLYSWFFPPDIIGLCNSVNHKFTSARQDFCLQDQQILSIASSKIVSILQFQFYINGQIVDHKIVANYKSHRTHAHKHTREKLPLFYFIE